MHINSFPVATLANLAELDPCEHLWVDERLVILVTIGLEPGRLRGVVVILQLARRLLLHPTNDKIDVK